MSTDWIKMRVDLREDPAVFRIAKLTKLDRLSVVGRLWAFWSWADKHAIHGQIDGADAADVDEIADKRGFSSALVDVGWLSIGDGFVAIPKHDRHTGESAKERSLKNARQARWRQSRDADVDGETSTNVGAEPSTGPSTRVDKRREEEKETVAARLVHPSPKGKTKPDKAKAQPLPADWAPSEETVAKLSTEVSVAPSVMRGAYVEAFRDACKAKGYEYLDFEAAFRNCVRQDWPKLRAKVNGHAKNDLDDMFRRGRE